MRLKFTGICEEPITLVRLLSSIFNIGLRDAKLIQVSLIENGYIEIDEESIYLNKIIDEQSNLESLGVVMETLDLF